MGVVLGVLGVLAAMFLVGLGGLVLWSMSNRDRTKALAQRVLGELSPTAWRSVLQLYLALGQPPIALLYLTLAHLENRGEVESHFDAARHGGLFAIHVFRRASGIPERDARAAPVGLVPEPA